MLRCERLTYHRLNAFSELAKWTTPVAADAASRFAVCSRVRSIGLREYALFVRLVLKAPACSTSIAAESS